MYIVANRHPYCTDEEEAQYNKKAYTQWHNKICNMEREHTSNINLIKQAVDALQQCGIDPNYRTEFVNMPGIELTNTRRVAADFTECPLPSLYDHVQPRGPWRNVVLHEEEEKFIAMGRHYCIAKLSNAKDIYKELANYGQSSELLVQYAKMLQAWGKNVRDEAEPNWGRTRFPMGKLFTQQLADRYNKGGLAYILAKMMHPERPNRMDWMTAITHMHLAKEFQEGFQASASNLFRTLDLCMKIGRERT